MLGAVTSDTIGRQRREIARLRADEKVARRRGQYALARGLSVRATRLEAAFSANLKRSVRLTATPTPRPMVGRPSVGKPGARQLGPAPMTSRPLPGFRPRRGPGLRGRLAQARARRAAHQRAMQARIAARRREAAMRRAVSIRQRLALRERLRASRSPKKVLTPLPHPATIPQPIVTPPSLLARLGPFARRRLARVERRLSLWRSRRARARARGWFRRWRRAHRQVLHWRNVKQRILARARARLPRPLPPRAMTPRAPSSPAVRLPPRILPRRPLPRIIPGAIRPPAAAAAPSQDVPLPGTGPTRHPFYPGPSAMTAEPSAAAMEEEAPEGAIPGDELTNMDDESDKPNRKLMIAGGVLLLVGGLYYWNKRKKGGKRAPKAPKFPTVRAA